MISEDPLGIFMIPFVMYDLDLIVCILIFWYLWSFSIGKPSMISKSMMPRHHMSKEWGSWKIELFCNKKKSMNSGGTRHKYFSFIYITFYIWLYSFSFTILSNNHSSWTYEFSKLQNLTSFTSLFWELNQPSNTLIMQLWLFNLPWTMLA